MNEAHLAYKKRTEILTSIYVLAVFITAAILAYSVVYQQTILQLKPDVLIGFLIWQFLVISADLIPIKLPRGNAVLSVGGAFDYGIILVFPIGLAAISGILSGAVSSIMRKVDIRRVIFNISANCITMILAATIINDYGPPIRELSTINITDWPLHTMIPSYLAAAVVYFIVNTGLTSVAIAINNNVPILSVWMTNYMWAIVSTLTIAPIGFIMAAVYHILSDNIILAALGLIIFMLPVIVTRTSYEWFASVNNTYFSAIKALITALDASHHYTQGHSRRVANNAVTVAHFMKLSPRDIETIERGAILHDIGKIGMDNSVLDKEGTLNSLEWLQMKQHTLLGSRIIQDLTFLRDARKIVLYHHERVDGKGYPHGLVGDEIPIGAKIVNAVDALDALTSTRSYRPAMTPKQALGILKTNSGSQFDTSVVQAVYSLFDQGELIFQQMESSEEEVMFTAQELEEALYPA
jgi:putative nucleotidyltransferase with HDIG domain